jgi:hypothetical protein
MHMSASRKRADGLNAKTAPNQRERSIEAAIRDASSSGFTIGREVLLDRVPGIVVAYNITSFGHFIGNTYPLVVRTAYGVTKCRVADLSLV